MKKIGSEMATHEDILEAIGRLEGLIEPLHGDLGDIKEMVRAWTTAKTGGRFIIWAGKLLLGLGAILVVVKTGVAGLFVLGGNK